MNLRAICRLISFVFLVMGLAQAACAGLAYPLGDAADVCRQFLVCAGVVLATGVVVFLPTLGRPPDLKPRDGFAVVVLGWFAAALAGSLPFLLTRTIPDFSGAFFESMSGLTTTGASVLANAEGAPRTVLLWRALTQFFGGMGVLVLVVAVLPLIGAGGMSLLRAEMTGPVVTRLTPRITTTAKLLWLVYLLLIAVEAALLRLGGMPWFDAVCHSFATLSSGGFSVRNTSIAAYGSVYIETVITVFMFLAGVNFVLLYKALRGELRAVWRDSELRFYLLVWAVFCLFFSGGLWASTSTTLAGSLRAATFTVTSVMTTTGFCTADYDKWPDFLRLGIVIVMFTGGCAGSTAGSIKMVRLLTVLKFSAREIRRLIHPQAVMPIKVNDTALDAAVLNSTLGFVLLYLAVFAAASLAMTPFFPDMVSAVSSAASALCNVGPGLGTVGPSANFAAVAAPGKLLLAFFMVLGRLELYTVLLLFAPAFWKR